jgi:flagellin
MGLRINNNLESFNAHRTLSRNALLLSKSMAKLSSGLRINTAADDAAGLGISERMRSQINGYAQASRNAQDGISMAQTAEGALGEVASMLQRVRELAVQHANGTNDTAARTSIEREGAALVAEINRVVQGTTWGATAIINSTTATTLQVGPDAGATNQMTLTAVDADGTTGANTTALAAMFPGTGAGTMNLTTIDNAINGISTMRGSFGAVVNRLEHTINANGIAQENLMAAESRIRDVDMAQEMANMTRLQILQESGMAMLAQANTQQSSVLRLLS